MKQSAALFLCVFLFLFSACSSPASSPETEPTETTEAVLSTIAEEITLPAATESAPSLPVPVMELTEEEQTMLLKLGMAERGSTGCRECIALVMRTVLNRVEADRFGSSIKRVIFAQDQFTPVADGSYDSAEPNELCREALELVICGWDESQGALYYEWCEGESWHSKNLHLLFQHCDVRFYD